MPNIEKEERIIDIVTWRDPQLDICFWYSCRYRAKQQRIWRLLQMLSLQVDRMDDPKNRGGIDGTQNEPGPMLIIQLPLPVPNSECPSVSPLEQS